MWVWLEARIKPLLLLHGATHLCFETGFPTLMWDSPMYAVNMFYYNWLIKKLL